MYLRANLSEYKDLTESFSFLSVTPATSGQRESWYVRRVTEVKPPQELCSPIEEWISELWRVGELLTESGAFL